MIMEKYGWERCNSEVLIRNTPRVYTLTLTLTHTHAHMRQPPTTVFVPLAAHLVASARRFRTPRALEPIAVRLLTTLRDCNVSIAIFCACLALAVGLEIVVFSPARRASRKLLERIVE